MANKYSLILVNNKNSLKEIIREDVSRAVKYDQVAKEEERIESIFNELKAKGKMKNTDSVNVVKGNYGELILPRARPLGENQKGSFAKTATSILISKNTGDFLEDLYYHKNKRVVDMDVQLSKIFTDREVMACLLREDFHNNKKTILKEGIRSVISSAVSTGAGIGIYLDTIGNFRMLIEQASNLFLSGPKFGYALAIFIGTGIIRSVAMLRIDRTRESKADMFAANEVGRDATASMLLKTQIAQEAHNSASIKEATRYSLLIHKAKNIAMKVIGKDKRTEKRIMHLYEFSG